MISFDAENDLEYFRMFFPNFADLNDFGGDHNLMMHYANEISRDSKAVKIVVVELDDGSAAFASVEAFLAPPDEGPSIEILRSVILRNYKALTYAVDRFREYQQLHRQAADD